MITASHNPSKYNGYKVYGPDGCQITTEAAKEILQQINAVNIFDDPYPRSLDWAESNGLLHYIDDHVLKDFIEAVKSQSVLFGDEMNRDVAIVYSPQYINKISLKKPSHIFFIFTLLSIRIQPIFSLICRY